MLEKTIEDPKIDDGISLPPVVFLFVSPLKGTHAKCNVTHKLAVFPNEQAARTWEGVSKTLKNMVGYDATLEEMLDIASKETGGFYAYFSDYSQ
jgi:hypothetical protein